MRSVRDKRVLCAILVEKTPTKGAFRVEGGTLPVEKISLGAPPSPP